MSIEALENLVKIDKLRLESPDPNEFNGMLKAAGVRLKDAATPGLSIDSQFALAYGAAHALALAALRWHGYRTDQRYLVFQCLTHTLGLSKAKMRLLDMCHNKRNLAEYEGHLEIDEQLLSELIEISNELNNLVASLEPIEP